MKGRGRRTWRVGTVVTVASVGALVLLIVSVAQLVTGAGR